MKQIQECVKATWIFFIVRFIASMLVGFIYIVIAAAIQYVFVTLFGETTFNYIIGGVLSLYLSVVVCAYVGRVLFMFIRGWHVAAIAYSDQINERNLPALDVGVTVFKKHFTSFAVVYGASVLIKKFASKGTEELWDLLKDVPYLCSLNKISKFPLVIHIGKDLLDTAFDAVIYYVVRYTKPGLLDDLSVFSKALRKYLCSLPSLLLSSLSLYFLCSVLPLALYLFTCFSLFWFNGFVAGILLNVLIYPIFYVIRHSLFEPLETIVLMSCFAKQCADNEDTQSNEFVERILSLAGLSEYFSEASGDGQSVDASTENAAETSSVPDAESTEPQNPIVNTSDASLNSDEDLGIDVEPLSEEEDDTDKEVTLVNSSPSNLFDIIRNSSGEDSSHDDLSDIEIAGEDAPPIRRVESLLNNLSPSMMNQAWNMMNFDEEDDSSDHNTMGGDDFDFS